MATILNKKKLYRPSFILTIIFSYIFTLFISCVEIDQQQNNPDKAVDIKKELFVYLVDISGSFNYRIEEPGYFNGKNYFELSCDQIIDEIRHAEIGQYHIVKQIKSRSFDESSFIFTLDLTDSGLFFIEPEPKNPYQKTNWIKSKENFERQVESLISQKKQNAIEAIEFFKKEYRNNFSKYTDVLYAIENSKIDFDSERFDGFSIKRLIIYSDFKETTTKNISEKNIVLNNVYVEGRFVTKTPYKNLEEYNNMLKIWEKVIQAKSLKFLNPEQSK